MPAYLDATTVWVCEVERCVLAGLGQELANDVGRGSRPSHAKPSTIKSCHDCSSKHEARDIAIAAKERQKMLERYLEDQKKGNKKESGPGKLFSR